MTKLGKLSISRNQKKVQKKVFYKKNGNEIDFFIEEINTNIQVCYKLNDLNFERETKPLTKKNNICKNILVYFDKNTEKKIDNIEIIDFIEFSNLPL